MNVFSQIIFIINSFLMIDINYLKIVFSWTLNLREIIVQCVSKVGFCTGFTDIN